MLIFCYVFGQTLQNSILIKLRIQGNYERMEYTPYFLTVACTLKICSFGVKILKISDPVPGYNKDLHLQVEIYSSILGNEK
jgi:hypothetical protein